MDYDDEVVIERPRRTWLFLAAVGITLTLGAGMAVGLIALSKIAPVKNAPPAVYTPPSKPEVVIQEIVKEVEVIKEVPAVQPAPPPVEAPPSFSWQGIWRRKNAQLPMFRLKEMRGIVGGEYAPDWNTVLSFRGGKVSNNGVEIVVDNNMFRVHFRLAMANSEAVRVTACVTDEDWMISLARANKMVRTPQEALIARKIMEENIKLTRKPQDLGLFYRGTEN
ncbi:MAG: hypothetical protein ACYC3I_07990 [Gemmataceae bacterium]